MAEQQKFEPGLVLDGRYRLERLLGEGGMGTIWAAHQLALGRSVAIKAIKAGRGDDHGPLEREARLLAAVHHPSIVQIYDFARTADGRAYVVMELVLGGSLESYLGSAGPMHAAEAVNLLLPLLDGLAAVHAAGIVHRDIKPANIVLADDGHGSIQAKLLDFGIARGSDSSARTLDGGLAGTPDYMAPEQFVGQRADARSDLWSLAATLYDMVAGVPPFTGQDLFTVMRKVREEPPPFPRDARGLDGKLWRVLTDTLRKQPEERPASALALRVRLAEWLTALGGSRTPAQLVAKSDASPNVAVAAQARDAGVAETQSAGASSFDALIKTRLGDR